LSLLEWNLLIRETINACMSMDREDETGLKKLTQLLKKILDFLFSDQIEPHVSPEFIISVDECIYVHFLLGNLNPDAKIYNKCNQMFNYLHGIIEFSRIFSQQETQDILEDIRKGFPRFVGKQGVEGYPFDVVLWNFIKACWYNGYNVLELIFITTTYPNELITKELVTRTLQYSKSDFGMKLIEEWNFLINSKSI